MVGPYLTILAGSIGLALCGCSAKDEPAPTQEPPRVKWVSELEHRNVSGNRYADAALLVQVSFTRGVHATDTSAVQTHISVVDDKLFWTRVSHGLGGERASRTVDLSADERDRVVQLLRDTQLVELETIRLAKQPSAPHEYASASVKIRLDSKDHSFAIAGVTVLDGTATAFSQTAALRAVTKVVAELQSFATTP